MRRILILGLAAAAGLYAADFDWKLRRGFPRPFVPAENPMSAEKVELGRYLFYDARISVNGKASCGTCHRQELAFTDGRARAVGATGQLHPRSSMSLANVAYNRTLTWARPDLSALEDQALIPMLGDDPLELGLTDREAEFLGVLRSDPIYRKLLARAFPEATDPFTLQNVVRAIVSFERSMVSMRSPYDRYRWGGEASAISESAKRGEIFFSSSERGGCFQCHGGWNFSGEVRVESVTRTMPPAKSMGEFFNTGVSSYAAPNRGLFERTRQAGDMGKFRAPSLRNIAVTAPYMHDGDVATLDGVIDHYAAGGRMDHPNKSALLRKFRITEEERRDLVEFLKSLTDEELLRDPRWSDPWRQVAR